MLIEDTNGKKAIFGNVDFPHIKSITPTEIESSIQLKSFFVFAVFEVMYTIPMSFRIITNMLRRLKTFNLIKKIIFGHFGYYSSS